jgi:hypothetical protein
MTDALHLYWDMAFLRTRSLFMIGVIFLFNLSRFNRVAEELANVFQSHLRSRHRNPPGQGYPTGVLTLPFSGSQGQKSLLTRPVTLPGSGQGTLQGRIEVETV